MRRCITSRPRPATITPRLMHSLDGRRGVFRRGTPPDRHDLLERGALDLTLWAVGVLVVQLLHGWVRRQDLLRGQQRAP